MKRLVNSEDGVFNEGLTVGEFLTVKQAEMVSVEINGRILKRTELESKELDKVEFLYLMGGGSGTHRTTN